MFGLTDDILENHGTTILLSADTINPTKIQRYPTTVTNGKHTMVYGLPIFRIALYVVYHHTIGYANIVRLTGSNLPVYTIPYVFFVELVSNVKEFLHM